ncbi:MAG: collagenase [Helicobacteraceae bacterium CG1_02_36_14]|nr:MAG: collagenase [Helicobacteraceae bacterium CG1_02_36_14]
MKIAEIMAPVGSFEALRAAIQAGADSVYFGVKQLNMRARSSHNFSLEELKEVKSICKKAGIKAYVTLNTLLYQHDLILMRQIIDSAKNAGIDAVIVQDIAAIQYAKEIGMPIHASTQLSISNIEAVRFYANYADTIVLAREVDMDMMKEICNTVKKDKIKGPSGKLVKIEVFVHGALCIAQSGRCQMSLLQTNTSAQRGACLQECRKSYRIIDDETGLEMRLEKNGYVMSPKDLCALPFLDKLIETGVDVCKIEGRSKSADYVYKVVKVYKEAVIAISKNEFTQEKIENWMTELKSVFNRGFCDGYYLGKTLPEWTESKGNKASEERLFVGQVLHYFPKPRIAELKIQANELKIGDKIVILGNTTGVEYGEITSMMKDEKKIKKSGKPAEVTIPFEKTVRKNDQVFLLRTIKENEDKESSSQ